MNSPKGRLNRQDLSKIVDGAVVAVVGALITYATTVVTQVDFGIYTPFVVALSGVLANTVRKTLAE